MPVLREHLVPVSHVMIVFCSCKDQTSDTGVRRASIAMSELEWFDDNEKEVHSGLGMFFNPKAWDSGFQTMMLH
jgi:hypothetical protein